MFENAMNIDRVEMTREKNARGTHGNQSLALAMAYVPMQCLKNAYSLEKALMAGTLFPELDKPLHAAKGGCANDH